MRMLIMAAGVLLATADAWSPPPAHDEVDAPAHVSPAVYHCSGAPQLDPFLQRPPAVHMPAVPYDQDTAYSMSVPTPFLEQERRLQECVDAYANDATLRELLHRPAFRERVHGWVLRGH